MMLSLGGILELEPRDGWDLVFLVWAIEGLQVTASTTPRDSVEPLVYNYYVTITHCENQESITQ